MAISQTHFRMRRVAATAAVLAGALTLAGCKDEKPAGPAGAGTALPVSVITAQAQDVPIGNQWVGTLDGYVNAQIQPQVTGYLLRQTYKEGSYVSKGQVLFQIDTRPFQALVDQAQGQVEQAKAQLELATINVNRDTPLAKEKAIAQSQLDNEVQTQAQASAQVKSAEASLATAKLNLGFTQVRSLISGIAGQATVQVGNLVSPQSVLTAVSQLDPVKVYFSISDSEYLGLLKQSKTSKSADVLSAAANLPLTLTLVDGSTYPHKGRIVFVDRQMNQQTGAIRIAAAFPNPGNVLRPGQFARVNAETQNVKNAILVPQAAVTDLQGIQQLHTLGADNKVHVVNVQVGAQVGPQIVITGGISPGTKIVVDQLQKLREGMPVSPREAQNNGTAPTAQQQK